MESLVSKMSWYAATTTIGCMIALIGYLGNDALTQIKEGIKDFNLKLNSTDSRVYEIHEKQVVLEYKIDRVKSIIDREINLKKMEDAKYGTGRSFGIDRTDRTSWWRERHNSSEREKEYQRAWYSQ